MPYKLTLPTGEVRTVPRVTEVVRAGMPRPALHEWELREVVKFTANYTRGRVASYEDVIAAWRRTQARHANRGTAVHKWIAAILKGEVPPALMSSQSGYKVAFTSWMVEHDIAGGLVEQTLTDLEVTVAGRPDFIYQGHLYDWKTVEKRKDDEKPYSDQIVQLGAYASMFHLVTDGVVTARRARAMFRSAPRVDAASVVRLYADGTHETWTLEGRSLHDAVDLWLAVRRVAQATMDKTAQ